jgi:hypothetical protein
MMIPSMSRSPAPLLASVGFALAATASPLVAQKLETISRGAPKVVASDSSGLRLRRLERTIDSLVRIFDGEELSPERRFKLRQEIDERFAEYERMAAPRKSERNVYIRRVPDVPFESRFGEVEAAVFDPANPASAKWQVLTTKDEPGRFPEVVFHGGRFVAAWLATQTGELRARTFTAERMAPAATIAPVQRRGSRLPSIAILPDGEEILFVWQEDEVMSRKVPAELGGFALLHRLCALF